MKLNISIPNFPGFYHSFLDLNDYFDGGIGYGNCDNITPYAFDRIDWKVTESKIAENFLNEFNNIHVAVLKKYGITLAFDGVTNPKEYNFKTDSLNCIATFNGKTFKSQVKKLLNTKENRNIFTGVINRHKSYEGFCSFYSDKLADWRGKDGYISNDLYTDNVIFESILIFLLEVENGGLQIDEITENVMESYHEYIEYLPMEADKEMADRYLLDKGQTFKPLPLKEWYNANKDWYANVSYKDFKETVKSFAENYSVPVN